MFNTTKGFSDKLYTYYVVCLLECVVCLNVVYYSYCLSSFDVIMKNRKIKNDVFIWLGIILVRLSVLIDKFTLTDSLLLTIPLYSVFVLVFYTSAHIVKRWIYTKRYLVAAFLYIVLFIVSIVVVGVVNRYVDVIIDTRFFIDYGKYGFFRILLVMVFGVFYQFRVKMRHTENKNIQITIEKERTELQFLKNQINPHFFFNTLNNIYGLAYTKDDNTPKVILKLSEAMRYIIYETAKDYVILDKELTFIQNYIELERIRVNREADIKLNIDIVNRQLMVAPLIMLSFIENCFKHSNIGDDTEQMIEINIWNEGNRLNFTTANTATELPISTEGGVGSVNVEKRLKLLYGDNYELVRRMDDDIYYVFLDIPLKTV